jgi:hypothetical protein
MKSTNYEAPHCKVFSIPITSFLFSPIGNKAEENAFYNIWTETKKKLSITNSGVS